MFKQAITLCTVLCLSGAAFAQHDGDMKKKVDDAMKKVQDATKAPAAKDGSSDPMPGCSPEEMQAWMEAGTPGDAHKWMAKLAGTWDCATKMFDPAMGTQESKGSMEITMLFDGRYQQGKFRGDMMGQPFEGLSTMAFDNVSKKYTSTWIDSMSTMMMLSTGTYNKDTHELVMQGEMTEPLKKTKITTREVSKYIDDNHWTMTFFHTRDGKEAKVMEMHMTRAGAAPAPAAAPANDKGAIDKAKEEAMKKAKEAAEKAKQKLPGH